MPFRPTGFFTLRPIACALFLSGFILAAWNIGNDIALLFKPASAYDPQRLLLEYSTLPRLLTAIVVGAALSLSGTLLQQVLRNPLASPTTLGTSAGANLALAVALLAFPAMEGLGRDTVAICGAILATCLVLVISGRRGSSPLSFILSGLMIGLWCSALSAILILLNERYLSGLFIWGAGSLAMQGWTIPLSLLPKIAVCALLAGMLARPLSLMELGDAGAISAGIPVRRVRIIAIIIAVILSALVTSAVGVIGFVGLIAPAITRLAGARRFRQQLVWSPIIGAGLLLVTDELVQLLSRATGAFLPTGSMTALFGAPIILLLLTKLRPDHRALQDLGDGQARRRHISRILLVLIALSIIAGLALAVLIGRAPDAGSGWDILPMTEWPTLLRYRWPRVVAAFAAGIMLGGAGVILQRLTGNEMASPELLGVSAGATGGVAMALFTFASTGFLLQLGFAGLGALAVLLIVLLLGLRSGFSPERVLLSGIVLTALLDALVGLLAAGGDPRAMILIRWMSGSTYFVDASLAQAAFLCATIFFTMAFLTQRWLNLLPLGMATARSVGLSVPMARAFLFIVSALMTASATLVVGPLSFVGLVGPHLAREMGFHRAGQQLVGGALAAGCLMVLADWVGRVIVFPYQIPAGLLAALLGAPFFIAVLMKK